MWLAKDGRDGEEKKRRVKKQYQIELRGVERDKRKRGQRQRGRQTQKERKTERESNEERPSWSRKGRGYLAERGGNVNDQKIAYECVKKFSEI